MPETPKVYANMAHLTGTRVIQRCPPPCKIHTVCVMAYSYSETLVAEPEPELPAPEPAAAKAAEVSRRSPGYECRHRASCAILCVLRVC